MATLVRKDGSIVVDGNVHWKTSGFLSSLKSWQTKYAKLTKDGVFGIYANYKEAKPELAMLAKTVTYQDVKGAGKENCLRITSDKGSFYMATVVQDPKKWKEGFKTFDAKEIDAVTNTPLFNSMAEVDPAAQRLQGRHKLETIDAFKWNIDEVVDWLSFLRDTDGTRLNEKFGSIFRDNDIDGKTLLALDDNGLKTVGIKSLGKRMKILKEVEKLKKRKAFCLNEHYVYCKFEKMDPKFLKTVGNLEDKVQSLSDPEEIRKTYLNPSVLESDLSEFVEEEIKDNPDGIHLVNNENGLSIYKPEQKIAVKLIVTEIVHSDKHKSLRRILSPVISCIPNLGSDFGMFHTALIVGPWYLEWTDSSLCIPKKISSSMALLTMDVETLSIPKQSISVLAERLAHVVTDWNVNYHYINFNLGAKKPFDGNCQDFVNAVLDQLEITPTFSGALANFLTEMKNKGKCEMEFQPDQEFIKKFQLPKDKFAFQTHQELDEFMYSLMLKCPTFKLDYENERTLLKSFDRAFWLRHFKKPEVEQFQPGFKDPKSGQLIHKCPFDDPRETGTMDVK